MGAPRVWRDEGGTWRARLYLGARADGRPERPQRSFPQAKDEAEARELARKWAEGLGGAGPSAGMGLVALLAEYVEVRRAMGASPNSVHDYRTYLGYCRRFLKGTRAEGLGALDFTRFERTLLERGGAKGQPLSPTTVNGVHMFLRGAYKWMVKSGLAPSNPLTSAERPRPARSEAIALCEADFEALASWLAEVLPPDPTPGATPRQVAHAMAMWLALHAGLRVGEACALRRLDVELARGILHVGGTVVERGRSGPWRKERPKSAKSRRNVSLTERELAQIRAYMDWQRSACGQTPSDAPLVSPDGGFCAPTAVSASFARVRRSLRIDTRATFHSLRHTHASWCLANGVDLVTLSERLGHASPDITARVYGHVISGRDEAAAKTFDELASRMERPFQRASPDA